VAEGIFAFRERSRQGPRPESVRQFAKGQIGLKVTEVQPPRPNLIAIARSSTRPDQLVPDRVEHARILHACLRALFPTFA